MKEEPKYSPTVPKIPLPEVAALRTDLHTLTSEKFSSLKPLLQLMLTIRMLYEGRGLNALSELELVKCAFLVEAAKQYIYGHDTRIADLEDITEPELKDGEIGKNWKIEKIRNKHGNDIALLYSNFFNANVFVNHMQDELTKGKKLPIDKKMLKGIIGIKHLLEAESLLKEIPDNFWKKALKKAKINQVQR